MGDFNAHVGTDTDTWKGVIGKHGVSGLNENGRYLLQLGCSNGLRIMNTFFQHREVHKYTWYRPSMDQKSLIDFCIVSSDLFSDVLDIRVKRGAELSTDHHLVVCSLQLSKPWPNKRSNRSSVTYRIKWEALEDEEVRKQFASSISSKFRQLPDVSEDIEREWLLFRPAIISSDAFKARFFFSHLSVIDRFFCTMTKIFLVCSVIMTENFFTTANTIFAGL